VARGIHEIDPQTAYTARQACAFLPSPSPAGLSLRTWHRWRKQGRFRAIQVGGRWCVYGAELLKLLRAEQCPEWTGRTPTERAKAIEDAERELRQLAPRTRKRRKDSDATQPQPQARSAPEGGI
jgi:hypothetical protein